MGFSKVDSGSKGSPPQRLARCWAVRIRGRTQAPGLGPSSSQGQGEHSEGCPVGDQYALQGEEPPTDWRQSSTAVLKGIPAWCMKVGLNPGSAFCLGKKPKPAYVSLLVCETNVLTSHKAGRCEDYRWFM